MESLERIEMPQCEQLRLSKIEQLIIDIEEAINTAELFEAIQQVCHACYSEFKSKERKNNLKYNRI